MLNFLARHQVQSHVAQSAHSMLGNSGRQAGNKRETSVESGGPENPKHTARQSETSGGQVGDKCRTMQLRASTAYWETSGRQLQNHGAQSTRSASHSGPGHLQHTGRQVGDKSRIRRSKASTPFFESGEPGTQLGES